MNQNTKFNTFHKKTLQLIGLVLIFLAAIVLFWQGNANSQQAVSARPVQVYFEGEYRIGDGEWQKIEEGKHISSTQGDVVLRGNFHRLTPDGEYIGLLGAGSPIAFYSDHISITINEGDGKYTFDHENPMFGQSACGIDWTTYYTRSDGSQPIEIIIHNPHKFGNETAIDMLLENVAIYAGTDFEKGLMADGELQRNIGILLVIIAFVILGTVLFSALIRIKNSKAFCFFGLSILCAGIYFMYSSKGIAFWSELIVSNTTMLGISMMLYCLFFSITVLHFLKCTKKIGMITNTVLGIVDIVCMLLPVFTSILFFDTWLYWAIIQLFANVLMIACLAKEIFAAKTKKKFLFASAGVAMMAFVVDFVSIGLGFWQGGIASKYVFAILFVAVMVVIIRTIPQNINAATRAKHLEIEKKELNIQLAESRISTMMSQIRPHFIYNTLGSVEQLCEIDPKKAGELVHNFAKYLRGNFGELDNPKPIRMSKEMEHVYHYVSIEKVRFPDMTFSFEMNSVDFFIPALTIQPIVENAIKHGLMRLQKGGTIKVVSYETDEHYCISVQDDGVGFDTNLLNDDRKHVGIRNIRERLGAMVNGTLEINSEVGVGTKVMIKIPKEDNK